MNMINNPHDSLVRETLSRKETAADFLKNYLPDHVLSLIDMDTLEISKDSFIEEKLADYYSDILYTRSSSFFWSDPYAASACLCSKEGDVSNLPNFLPDICFDEGIK